MSNHLAHRRAALRLVWAKRSNHPADSHPVSFARVAQGKARATALVHRSGSHPSFLHGRRELPKSITRLDGKARS